jgi:hypothetical protein
MAYDQLIKGLDSEISNLQQARKLLQGSLPAKKPAQRVISPEGRKRMQVAQRKRWAAVKKSA